MTTTAKRAPQDAPLTPQSAGLTTFKTKSLAAQNARGALGEDATEGLDFKLANTGAGWIWNMIAGTSAKAADAPPLADDGLIDAKTGLGAPIRVRPDDPLLVNGVMFPNKTRAMEARRAIERAPANPPKAPSKPKANAAKSKAAPKANAEDVIDAAIATERLAEIEADPSVLVSGRELAARLARTIGNGGPKVAKMVELMRAKDGATIQEMADATGMNAESVKARMRVEVRRGLALTVEAVKSDGGETRYRIASAADQEAI